VLDGRTYDEKPPRIDRPVLDDSLRLAAIAEINASYSSAAEPPQPALGPM
jgi:hypothetical protein